MVRPSWHGGPVAATAASRAEGSSIREDAGEAADYTKPHRTPDRRGRGLRIDQPGAVTSGGVGAHQARCSVTPDTRSWDVANRPGGSGLPARIVRPLALLGEHPDRGSSEPMAGASAFGAWRVTGTQVPRRTKAAV